MEEKINFIQDHFSKKIFDGILDNNFDCFAVILSLLFYLLLSRLLTDGY
jgi:hypothetical protein